MIAKRHSLILSQRVSFSYPGESVTRCTDIIMAADGGTDDPVSATRGPWYHHKDPEKQNDVLAMYRVTLVLAKIVCVRDQRHF